MSDSEVNQCDGCRNEMPIVDGIHRKENGTCFMVCTGNRYESKRVSDWISVDKALPEAFEEVVAYCTNFGGIIFHDAIYYDDSEESGWCRKGDDKPFLNVTHWQSLPPPPE